MEPASHTIRVPKTAHFYTLGRPGPQVRYCWIACHGYGQLAKNFIHKFTEVARDDTFVLAPEGFSRFYWQGFSGDVGASWMTREDRLSEIADYTNYLQTLYDHFIPRLSPEVRIVLFGFSQGCATHFRWVMKTFPHFDHLLLWAGTVPEDLDYRPHHKYFAFKKLHFVYGTEDPFITDDRLNAHRSLIREQQLDFEVHTFQGKHEVDRNALRELEGYIRLD
jgi:predicted esterase